MKKKEFNRIIGQNISELREAAGFTQDALAERLEISKSFLAHIEQGDRSFSVTRYRQWLKCWVPVRMPFFLDTP